MIASLAFTCWAGPGTSWYSCRGGDEDVVGKGGKGRRTAGVLLDDEGDGVF